MRFIRDAAARPIVCWMLLSPLTACAVETAADDDPDVAFAEAPLIGGHDTAIIPAIGTMSETDANGTIGCTVTLVGTRYVLTAGHCVNYTNNLNSASVTFSNHKYTVGNIRNFSTYAKTNQSSPVPGGGEDDVALMRLTQDVPADLVAPAAMAAFTPAARFPPYGTQTIFGYGCKNRATESGGGNKQYVTFTYGNPTQVLCSGDSGGPVVFDGPTALGAVWGTNSGYLSDGTDVFGNVPYFKEAMMNVIRQWENMGTTEIGMKRIGLDYSTINNATSTSCMYACQDDAKCRAFTFDAASAQCSLKSAVGDWQFAPNRTSMSAQGLVYDLLRGRPGNTYSTIAGLVTFEACMGACARDTSCKAYSFNIGAGSCELKNATPAAVVDFVSVSGVKRGIEVNVDRPGPDYSHAITTSAEVCKQSCAKDYQCRTFTWVQSTRACYLHATPTQPTGRTGATSGLKGGLDINTDRIGADYTNFNVNGGQMNVPSVCQAACAADANCQSWVFSPLGWHGRTRPHCWLNNAVPATSPADGLVSGVRGAEFF